MNESIRETNLRIARALGIDTKNVIGFELRCWAGEVPTLRITKNEFGQRAQWDDEAQFDIVLRDRPFDLETACADAMRRVQAGIEKASDRALRAIKTMPKHFIMADGRFMTSTWDEMGGALYGPERVPDHDLAGDVE